MKYITLIIGLLVAGCGKQEQADANESTPTTNTNKVDGTTVKPVKELTVEEKVVGTYEHKDKAVYSVLGNPSPSGEARIQNRIILSARAHIGIYQNGKKYEKPVYWHMSSGTSCCHGNLWSAAARARVVRGANSPEIHIEFLITRAIPGGGGRSWVSNEVKVYRINKDSSITLIVHTDGSPGSNVDLPIYKQFTFKKIK